MGGYGTIPKSGGELSAPPRFSVPKIPLESIGLHNPQRPIFRPVSFFFSKVLRMAQIEIENLTKIFHVSAKAPGLGSGVEHVFHSLSTAPHGFIQISSIPQFFATWVLAFAFVAYYPTLLLLDKMTSPPLLGSFAPLAGLAATIVNGLVGRHRLVSYQGIRS
jgi:hypothetical protein